MGRIGTRVVDSVAATVVCVRASAGRGEPPPALGRGRDGRTPRRNGARSDRAHGAHHLDLRCRAAVDARTSTRIDLAAVPGAVHGRDVHRLDLLAVPRSHRAGDLHARPRWLGPARQRVEGERASRGRARAGDGMTQVRRAIDVSELPNVTFGPRSLMWWGTLGFMTIEGWTVAILLVSYIYLRQSVVSWPPERTPTPSLEIGRAHG